MLIVASFYEVLDRTESVIGPRLLRKGFAGKLLTDENRPMYFESGLLPINVVVGSGRALKDGTQFVK
jgi:hypothetical protein